jgi:hypothetical protein
MQVVQFRVAEIFHLHQGRARRLDGSNQLVQFKLDDLGIAILCILNQKHDQEGAERSGRVDDELPSIGVVEARSDKAPNDDARNCKKKCPRRTDRVRGPMRKLPEVFFHGDTIIAHGKPPIGRWKESVFYRLVTVAPADGADFQMKAGMFRMAAIVDEIFRCLLGRADLRKDSIDRVVFAIMRAQTTLTFMQS